MTEQECKNTLVDFKIWKDSLYSETHVGETFWEVPTHYKWLNEKELFDYFMQNINNQPII